MSPSWSVLILSRHAPKAASSRLRTFQYVPYLEAIGAKVIIEPFFDEPYLEKLYLAGRRNLVDVITAYIRRIRAIFTSNYVSVVWVEKEVFPFLPACAESLLARFGTPYLVDYDDATFHNYDLHRFGLIRFLLGQKLHPLLRKAVMVTAGNAYLEAYARSHGATHVLRIPTVVDLSRYPIEPEPPDGELRIGWIGTPETSKYLNKVRSPLKKLSSLRKIRFVTIGAPPLSDFGVPLEQHSWSENAEAQLLSSVHVGIMPLPDEPFERGKCGYKLIQYMACGRPIIASPIGVNIDIATPDVGFIAKNDKDWVNALIQISVDRNLRCRLGSAGRTRVERDYSLQSVAPKVCGVLSAIARGELGHPR